MHVIADGYTHRALHGTVVSKSGARFHAHLTEFAVALVFVEEIRSGVVGDKYILPPGAVEVRPRHTKTVVAVGVVDACSLAHVAKRPIAVIVEQGVACARHAARSALHVESAILAGWRLSETRQI